MAVGLKVEGWCPAGRRAEDGPIPERYPLHETGSAAYRVRTRFNVRDADATLIVAPKPLVGGTALTVTVADEMKRPLYHLLLHADSNPAAVDLAPLSAWIAEHDVRTLNVAGPRASTVPGIYAPARAVLTRLFTP